VLLPGLLFIFLVVWPWIERWITRDDREHHLLDLPREVPLHTSLGVALTIFAAGLTLAGSTDVQTRYLHLPVNAITIFYRWFCGAGPFIGFAISYAICSELRKEGGVHEAPRIRVRRNAAGGFDEEQI
jgi:ubiquinol-cytochrome c reductase cytochrome b subunit